MKSAAAPLSELQVKQLVSMFARHRGFLPAYELTADNFDIEQLERDGFIFRTANHLENGCFLIGDALKRAVSPHAL